jgi:hypothetical protein
MDLFKNPVGSLPSEAWPPSEAWLTSLQKKRGFLTKPSFLLFFKRLLFKNFSF